MSIPEHQVIEALVKNQSDAGATTFDATALFVFSAKWRTCGKDDRMFLNIVGDHLTHALNQCIKCKLDMTTEDFIFMKELLLQEKTVSDLTACLKAIDDRKSAALPDHYIELAVVSRDWDDSKFHPQLDIGLYDTRIVLEVIKQHASNPTTAIQILCDFNGYLPVVNLAQTLELFYYECRTSGICLNDADRAFITLVLSHSKETTKKSAPSILQNHWRPVPPHTRAETVRVIEAVNKEMIAAKKKQLLLNQPNEKEASADTKLDVHDVTLQQQAIVTQNQPQEKACEQTAVTKLVVDADRTPDELTNFFIKLQQSIAAQAQSKCLANKPKATSKSNLETPKEHTEEPKATSKPNLETPKEHTKVPMETQLHQPVPHVVPINVTVWNKMIGDSIVTQQCLMLMNTVTRVLEEERGNAHELPNWESHPCLNEWILTFQHAVQKALVEKFGKADKYSDYEGVHIACLYKLFGSPRPDSVNLLTANIQEFSDDIIFQHYPQYVYKERLASLHKRRATNEILFSSKYCDISVLPCTYSPLATSAEPVQFDVYDPLDVYVRTINAVQITGVTSTGLKLGLRNFDILPIESRGTVLHGHFHPRHPFDIFVVRTQNTPAAYSNQYVRRATQSNNTDNNSSVIRINQDALREALAIESLVCGQFYFSVHDYDPAVLFQLKENNSNLIEETVECKITWSDGEQSTIVGVRLLTGLEDTYPILNGDIVTNNSANLLTLSDLDLTGSMRVFRPHFGPVNDDNDDENALMHISAFFEKKSIATLRLDELSDDLVILDKPGRDSSDLDVGDIIVRVGKQVATMSMLIELSNNLSVYNNLTANVVVKKDILALEERPRVTGVIITSPLLQNTTYSEIAAMAGIRDEDVVSRLYTSNPDGSSVQPFNTKTKYSIPINHDRMLIFVHAALNPKTLPELKRVDEQPAVVHCTKTDEAVQMEADRTVCKTALESVIEEPTVEISKEIQDVTTTDSCKINEEPATEKPITTATAAETTGWWPF